MASSSLPGPTHSHTYMQAKDIHINKIMYPGLGVYIAQGGSQLWENMTGEAETEGSDLTGGGGYSLLL